MAGNTQPSTFGILALAGAMLVQTAKAAALSKDQKIRLTRFTGGFLRMIDPEDGSVEIHDVAANGYGNGGGIKYMKPTSAKSLLNGRTRYFYPDATSEDVDVPAGVSKLQQSSQDDDTSVAVPCASEKSVDWLGPRGWTHPSKQGMTVEDMKGAAGRVEAMGNHDYHMTGKQRFPGRASDPQHIWDSLRQKHDVDRLQWKGLKGLLDRGIDPRTYPYSEFDPDWGVLKGSQAPPAGGAPDSANFTGGIPANEGDIKSANGTAAAGNNTALLQQRLNASRTNDSDIIQIGEALTDMIKKTGVTAYDAMHGWLTVAAAPVVIGAVGTFLTGGAGPLVAGTLGSGGLGAGMWAMDKYSSKTRDLKVALTMLGDLFGFYSVDGKIVPADQVDPQIKKDAHMHLAHLFEILLQSYGPISRTAVGNLMYMRDSSDDGARQAGSSEVDLVRLLLKEQARTATPSSPAYEVGFVEPQVMGQLAEWAAVILRWQAGLASSPADMTYLIGEANALDAFATTLLTNSSAFFTSTLPGGFFDSSKNVYKNLTPETQKMLNDLITASVPKHRLGIMDRVLASVGSGPDAVKVIGPPPQVQVGLNSTSGGRGKPDSYQHIHGPVFDSATDPTVSYNQPNNFLLEVNQFAVDNGMGMSPNPYSATPAPVIPVSSLGIRGQKQTGVPSVPHNTTVNLPAQSPIDPDNMRIASATPAASVYLGERIGGGLKEIPREYGKAKRKRRHIMH